MTISSEALRQRLSSLRQGQARPEGAGPVGAAAPRPERTVSSNLGQCFPEGAVRRGPRGEVFTCELPLRELHSDASRLTESYLGAFEAARRLAREGRLPRYLEPLEAAKPAETALIDTETAGFHGRPLFLVGLLRWQGDGLGLTQLFARDYAEEAAVLERLAGLLPGLGLLISFNGKAFDWPFVRDRMSYHRLRCEEAPAHLDLLHPSRRRWRERLPNCKLQTLERYLCGRWRSGDLPSHEIPQRYHDFVREQDARLIAPVFHHNRLDLITMAELLVALVRSEG